MKNVLYHIRIKGGDLEPFRAEILKRVAEGIAHLRVTPSEEQKVFRFAAFKVTDARRAMFPTDGHWTAEEEGTAAAEVMATEELPHKEEESK